MTAKLLNFQFLVFVLISIPRLIFGQLPDSIKYDIEPLGTHINTPEYDEISPIITNDGKSLYFTRVASPNYNKTLYYNDQNLYESLSDEVYNRKLRQIYSQIAQRTIINPVSSSFNQDIYIASGKEKIFEKIDHPDYPLNSALPNSICSKTTEKDKFIIVNKYSPDGSMEAGFSYIKKNSSGGYDFPQAIEITDFHTRSEEVGLCMVPDGNAIILTLDREEGYGDLDLYVCFKIDDTHWSKPLNLGPNINTANREIAPFVSVDNNRLYFSSNRTAKGDFDIYYTSRQAYSWRQWTRPIALPSPINSPFNESQAFLLEKTNDLYFITDRDGTDDIYRANLNPIILKDKTVIIHGRIVNSETGKTVRGLLNYGPASKEKYEHFFNSYTGEFIVKIIFKKDFRFNAEKPGFIGSELILDPDQFTDSLNHYDMVLEVTPSRNKKFIEVGNIQFARTEAKILKTSLPELNRLARVLKQNKYLRIRIEGHTDNVGDKSALRKLSKNRANAIKKYLVKKAIPNNRIETHGYGDLKPLNDNLTEEDKRINRRVEVRILRDLNK